MQFKLGQKVMMSSRQYTSIIELVGVIVQLPLNDRNPHYIVEFKREYDKYPDQWYFLAEELVPISKFQYFYSI